MSKILFLDIATKCGWAVGRPGDPIPIWGVWLMPEGSYGTIFNAFQNVLEDAIAQHEPTVVGIEDAIPQRDNFQHTARLTLGLHAIADLVCHQAGIAQQRPSVGRIRSAVIGRSRLTELEKAIRPRVTVKNQIVLPWCVARGWQIDSPDARDAACGWAYLAGIRAPRKKIDALPRG